MRRRHFLRNGLWLTGAALGFPTIAQVMPSARRAVVRPVAASGFTYYASAFNGSTDVLSRASAMTISDSSQGSISCWVKMDDSSGDTTAYYILVGRVGTASRFAFYRNTSGEVRVDGRNSSATLVMRFNSTTSSILAATGWVHILLSWDLVTPSSAQVYLNGTSALGLVNNFVDDAILDFASCNNWYCGANAASGFYYGSLSELWFATTAIDFSQEANRLKFRSVAGHPVDLGADGSTPGVSPVIYLRRQVPNFEINDGSGEDFTDTGVTDDPTIP